MRVVSHLVCGCGGEGEVLVIHISHEKSVLESGNVASIVVDQVQRGVSRVTIPLADIKKNKIFDMSDYDLNSVFSYQNITSYSDKVAFR